MSAVAPPEVSAAIGHGEMQDIMDRQRRAFRKELPVSRQVREDRLDRAIALLLEHQDELCEAMRADFGHRPVVMSKFVDIVSAINALKHARSHVGSWMKKDRRSVRFPLNMLGARAWVEYQPLGVVGIISPWNFPVNLTFAPLAGVLAAGNRCMIKPSELTPRTSALMAELIGRRFDAAELWVATGGPEVGKAFSALPFDHLLFTGATAVGRHIMRAAADNLTPVTLELGGKSPAIIGSETDLQRAADRIVLGKLMNAGQVCLAPDYACVPSRQLEAFVAALKSAGSQMYPQAAGNDQYTMVINDRHRDRIERYIQEAQDAGVEVVTVQAPPADEDDRRLPLTLLIDPPEDLAVMRDEIFGPVLPIKSYGVIDEVIDYVNDHDRPLALYYFGDDDSERRLVLDRTISGGVTLDDVIFHISVEELPFGGVGASGMGAYHGFDGFRTFSHGRGVYRQPRLDIARLIGARPPYGKRLQQMMDWDLRK